MRLKSLLSLSLDVWSSVLSDSPIITSKRASNLELDTNMFISTLATSISTFIHLTGLSNAAPIETHATLLKRATGVQISASPDFCIGVEVLANGARVTDKNCTTFGPTSNPPFYNKWDISPGNNQGVKLSGIPAGSGDFCLDSGDSLGSYPPAKIWKCYPGLPAQQ
jgi:hypothetical protein